MSSSGKVTTTEPATTPLGPNQTLYLNNLPTTISKQKLGHALYCLFTQYGQIIDMVALKTPKMRGQAFIVYKELQSAVVAMRTLQSFNFFGKQMRIQFAKTKSMKSIEFDKYVIEPLKKQLKMTRMADGGMGFQITQTQESSTGMNLPFQRQYQQYFPSMNITPAKRTAPQPPVVDNESEQEMEMEMEME